MVNPVGHRRWYVVKTRPNAERLVQYILTTRRIAVYMPMLKRRRLAEPLFPGYLFLKIDCRTDEYCRSRSAPGVSYILSAEGKPIPVEDELVEEIKRRVNWHSDAHATHDLAPGDRVAVAAGPFRDVEAIFDREISPRGRCLVLLNILGRMTRVEVDAQYLVKVGSS